MTFIRLALIALTLSACVRLDNQIHYVRLVCGSEISLPDSEFSLYRIRDAEGQTLDLAEASYEVLSEGFVSVPKDQYRLTSSGCLQIKKQQKAFLRLPLRGEASPTLMDDDGLKEVQLILDKTPPTISLPVVRSNFRSGESLDVKVNEASRTRYCIDTSGEDRCTLKDGPRLAFESTSFQDFDGQLQLPKAEGTYRLTVVAEDRSGLTGLFLQNFTVDSTIPVVEVDFSQAESFLFDGKSHFYLDQGYRLGFRSQTEPLNQLKIEYCLVSSQAAAMDACAPEAIQIYGVENPEALPPGSWTLFYRATDLSGNRAEGWDSLHVLAKSICTEHELLNALNQPEAVTCTELVGDLSVNRVAVENYDRLKSLVAVSGKIAAFESERETLPTFPNLRRLTKLDIRENYELLEIDMMPSLVSVEDIDISSNDAITKLSGFHQLTHLRNLTIASGDDALDNIDAFGALKRIEGKLSLDYLAGLQNLNFLRAIEFIDSITLFKMEGLSSLMALKSCHIGNSLELLYVPSLTNFYGLENMKAIGNFHITGTGVSSLEGLENLARIDDELKIYGNSELVNLDALQFLSVIKTITIKKNSSLKEINWQAVSEGLQSVVIEENEALTVIKGFDALTEVGYLIFDANPELKSISGWAKLKELSSLTIKNNESLESVDFAPELTELQSSIEISGNGKIKSIQGFGRLNEIPNLDIVVKADLEASKNALSSYTILEDM